MEESCLQRLLFNKMLNFPVLPSGFKYDASFWFLKTVVFSLSMSLSLYWSGSD